MRAGKSRSTMSCLSLNADSYERADYLNTEFVKTKLANKDSRRRSNDKSKIPDDSECEATDHYEDSSDEDIEFHKMKFSQGAVFDKYETWESDVTISFEDGPSFELFGFGDTESTRLDSVLLFGDRGFGRYAKRKAEESESHFKISRIGRNCNSPSCYENKKQVRKYLNQKRKEQTSQDSTAAQ